MFDYQNKETFTNVRKWIDIIKTRATINFPSIVVLGNKKDLAGAGVQVLSEEVDLLRAEDNDIMFFESSARTGLNLDESIGFMCKKMIEY